MAAETLFQTTVTAVGPEAADLLAGGVLILFDRGAPPELAEISVLHDNGRPTGRAPVRGDWFCIGSERFEITGVGEAAWRKVGDLGHVVLNFTGAASPDRPGEICLAPAGADAVLPLLVPGAVLEVRARAREG